MFNQNDPYSYTKYYTLYIANHLIGRLTLDYRVALYNDVQAFDDHSVQQEPNQQFYVHCTQRISITNTFAGAIGPNDIGTESPELKESFNNYPALIESVVLVEPRDGLKIELLDFSPKTVNTAVQTSQSNGATKDSNNSSTTTSTTGSSYSQSSTYGVSVSVGNMYGLTVSAENTFAASKEKSSSNSDGQSSSVGNSSGMSESMSIKDWGSYASVNPVTASPTWVFGQEYPWNAIECKYSNGVKNPAPSFITNDQNQIQLLISPTMQENLYQGNVLYPPSELSMYGLTFITKSSWRVYIDNSTSSKITIGNHIYYFTASHLFIPSTDDGEVSSYVPAVYMDETEWELTCDKDGKSIPDFTFDLNIMGLDPIGVNTNIAVVGFTPSKFIPSAQITTQGSAATLPQKFKTIAPTNDLIIENSSEYVDSSVESGFSVSQSCLSASWKNTYSQYKVSLYFKVTDLVQEYTLYIKHWVGQQTGVMLKIVINQDTTNSIERYVDALEGQGGGDNLLKLSLRDLDFASINYHDFLQLGLNSIEISILPATSSGDSPEGTCVYQIRAISIKRNT
ncbi:hypothetical protein [Undibacterium sp. RuTC16W]|uniref:hypothetical protein n=1 Tax=Undibacterium sp. RuTC16W TaxID=3413048 RepID=UPI003BF18655